jgi:hypothetical protein
MSWCRVCGTTKLKSVVHNITSRTENQLFVLYKQKKAHNKSFWGYKNLKYKTLCNKCHAEGTLQGVKKAAAII